MPNNSSQADLFLEWEQMMTAAGEYKELLPSAGPYLLQMKETFDQVKVLKARQESYQASRRLTTQELGALLTQGRELAIRLRGAIKADLGPKSELLGYFGIAPLRRRTRRPADEKPTPTGSQTGASTPEAEPVKPAT